MLTKTSRTAVILALILSATILGAADTANELKLQQAIDLLESKGDPARAMPLFEQASRSNDRALASRALLYMGGIQERQGKEAARAIYDRIVRDFGNQSAAAEAQKRLMVLGVVPSDNMKYTRLIEVSDDVGSLSPDGLSMAVIDWDDSGDIAIQDTATGKLRRLLAKPAVADDPWDAYGEWASLSPDQSKVLFLWDPVEDDVEYQLRVMANKPGSSSRVLFQLNDEVTWIDTGVWFPDSQSALIQTSTKDREWQFVRVGVAGKSFQVIKSLQWRLQGVEGRPSISPDGKYIAYAALANNPSRKPAAGNRRPTAPDSTDQYIYILPADGSGQETIVARSAGINEAPVWTSDGSRILFMSDRSVANRTGAFGLWSVEIVNGKAQGAPSPVKAEMGRVKPIGVTRAGSYYFVQGTNGVDVFTAELQPGGAKLKRSPTRLTETAAEVNSAPAWSPDGKKVAFKRQRPQNANAQNPNLRGFDLVVHTVETGEERVFSANNITDTPPVWFHDGRYVLTLAGNQLLKVDVDTREFRSLEAIMHAALPTGIRSFALSPDDRTLYVATIGDVRRNAENVPIGRQKAITSIDTSTGEAKQIYSTVSNAAGFNMVLSPDGRNLAAVLHLEGASNSRLIRMSVDGANIQDLGPASPNTAVEWTKDQKILFWAEDPSKQSRMAVMPATGGVPEYTSLGAGISIRSINISTDGSRVVFAATTGAEELWKIDNVSSMWRER